MGEGKGFAHLYLPKEIWKPRGLGERAAGALPPPPRHSQVSCWVAYMNDIVLLILLPLHSLPFPCVFCIGPFSPS